MIIKYRIALVRSRIDKLKHKIKCFYRTRIKGQKSFYMGGVNNPHIHPGELPIRVLKGNFEHWIQTVNPAFYQTFREQVNQNGLNPNINYNTQRVQIVQNNTINAAKITFADRRIHIYDTFSAYVWCVCYSMTVLFDEVIQIPHLRGNYTGQFDHNNKQIESALGVFEYGMTLTTRYRDWDRGIPNPEEYGCSHSYYIEKVNGMYLAAMYFIFCHEVGHNVFNHMYTPATNAQSLQDELDADNFAIDQVLLPDNSPYARTFKHGGVAAMCALLFLNRNLYRGGRYPDAHQRIDNVIARMELSEEDHIWGMASLAFRMWGLHYNIEFQTPRESPNYMDLFSDILIQLQRINRPNR